MSARILVIEDNPENLELMLYLLRASGYHVSSARDGVEGLAAVQGNRPDLIICDVHMPCMDGFGVIARLKNDAELRTIPVIAVTALAMVGDADRVLNAGFDGYLSKPIDPELVVDLVKKYLGG